MYFKAPIGFQVKHQSHLAVEVQLLHVLVGVADADERAQLAALLALAGALHLLALPPPAVAVEVDAGRRAEEPLLVAVRLLRHLGVQHDDDHVAAVAQVLPHRLLRQPLVLGRPEQARTGKRQVGLFGCTTFEASRE